MLPATSQGNPTLLSKKFCNNKKIITKTNYISGTLSKALEDKGFDLPSPEAATAKCTARAMMKWMTLEMNKTAIQPLESYLCTLFHLWIDKNPPVTSSIREQIWLYALVSSPHQQIIQPFGHVCIPLSEFKVHQFSPFTLHTTTL